MVSNTRRAHVPDDAPATAVDGLREEPHETYAAAAIHQVDASRHLHCMRPPPTPSSQKLAQSFYLYYEKLITLLIFSKLLLFACSVVFFSPSKHNISFCYLVWSGVIILPTVGQGQWRRRGSSSSCLACCRRRHKSS